jgi:hypothetical protein
MNDDESADGEGDSEEDGYNDKKPSFQNSTDKLLQDLIDSTCPDKNDAREFLIGSTVIAKENFIPTEPEHLELNIGDLIILIDVPSDSKWVFGVLGNGIKGWFPRHSVDLHTSSASAYSFRELLKATEEKSILNARKTSSDVLNSTSSSNSILKEKEVESPLQISDNPEWVYKETDETVKKLKFPKVNLGKLLKRPSFFNYADKEIDTNKNRNSTGPDFLNLKMFRKEKSKVLVNPEQDLLSRKEVFDQLVISEKEYVSRVNFIIQEFFKPMQSIKSITPKQISLVFSNIEQIQKINIELLTQLETMGETFDTDKFCSILKTFVCKYLY